MEVLNELNKLADIIKSSEDNYVLISHVGPDGDNIGSLVGLALGLLQLKKKVTVINADPTPKKYHFLEKCISISAAKEYKKQDGNLIVLDCPDLKRTGLSEDAISSFSRVVNIDHHISNILFGDINLVDTSAAATGEIVFKLLQKLNIDFTPDISTPLYTAIMTDTGSFRYENTTGFSLETGAFLINHGADLNKINVEVYETFSPASIRFMAAALKKLEIAQIGTIAWIIVTNEMYKQFGVNEDDFEGLVNYAKSIAGIEVAFLVKEGEDSTLKVSLRSKGVIDVNEIAAKFGGGGHKKAAGFMTGDYSNYESLVKDILFETSKMLASGCEK
ncbi:MAG: bifunctional oligoribonuclease/PAP phosphatase NrnA [Clostridia bacterium]|nr:bifunctional oligoribonuclease/PAP phosphatase NrnA [Clostridia bacterium]